MRRYFNAKIAFAASVVVAIILALSAIFIPAFRDGKQEEGREVFLPLHENIAVDVQVDDVTHYLGEKFTLTFVVQYNNEDVDVNSIFLDRVGLSPFEVIGNAEIDHKEVNRNISEYTYEFELMTVEGLPGNSYAIEGVELSYTLLDTGEVVTVDISPDMFLHISSYFDGQNIESVELRPYMSPLYSNDAKLHLTIIAFFFFLLLAVLYSSREEEERTAQKKAQEEIPEEELLSEQLAAYKDKKWLRGAEPRTRMHELEIIIVRLAYVQFGVDAETFYRGGAGKKLKRTLEVLHLAYQQEELTYEHVINLAKNAEKALTVPNDERGRQ